MKKVVKMAVFALGTRAALSLSFHHFSL